MTALMPPSSARALRAIGLQALRTDRPFTLLAFSALFLCFGLFATGRALAGPNAGGTLVAHDSGLSYTSDSASYPSPPPAIDPPGVDNQLPAGLPPDAQGWVWKVYAAFATGSSPRLKALTMGEQFGGDVVVLAGGLPSPGDFEITQDGWPTTSGGGVGLSFGEVQTAQAVECYWFGGYGYQGGIFAIAPHPTQEMLFVDDSAPPQVDPIAGLSTIGFGVDGQTSYPTLPPPPGACCYPDGHCELVAEAECAGVWYGEGSSCAPNPCPPPPSGACCEVDGSCWTMLEEDCWTGVWLSGVPCDPNPCPQPPTGACCYPTGECFILTEMGCGGVWLGPDTVCEPNPCPQPPPFGACCFAADGHCEYVEEASCPTGDWRIDVACDPNPCPQPPYGACCYFFDGHCESQQEVNCGDLWLGADTTCDPNPCPPPPPLGACCFPDGACESLQEMNCGGSWLGADTVCDPNPCPQPPPGACCHPDGACEFIPEYACTTGDWREGVECDPNPCPALPFGACCFATGVCVYTAQEDCPTGDWREGVPCVPNPCPQPPPTGACCLGLSCTVTMEPDCAGQWQGPGTDCDPNPCCRHPMPQSPSPAPAREFTRSDGPHPSAGDARSEIEIEYDGEAWWGWGTSPNWTDESVVNFEVPAGGPYVVAEVRAYIFGTGQKDVHFWESTGLYDPPGDCYTLGPSFSTPFSGWPPADWTTIDVLPMWMMVHSGEIVAPGIPFFGTGDGIGLADAFADGNPGHSWTWYAGGWLDDTYGYNTDDGIRLGLNYGGSTPVIETTWGRVKALYK